ncbi:MAG: hypothetical protein ACJAWI_000235 [Marinomonas primoryensis]|jgi:hypothetical protein
MKGAYSNDLWSILHQTNKNSFDQINKSPRSLVIFGVHGTIRGSSLLQVAAKLMRPLNALPVIN